MTEILEAVWPRYMKRSRPKLSRPWQRPSVWFEAELFELELAIRGWDAQYRWAFSKKGSPSQRSSLLWGISIVGSSHAIRMDSVVNRQIFSLHPDAHRTNFKMDLKYEGKVVRKSTRDESWRKLGIKDAYRALAWKLFVGSLQTVEAVD